MLIEIQHISQRQGEPRKRWFTSRYFDLSIWTDKFDKIIRFELCYAKYSDERALCWSYDAGYQHLRVDDGEGQAIKYKMAPLYLADGDFDKEAVLQRFIAESNKIDPKVVKEVLDKIQNYQQQPT